MSFAIHQDWEAGFGEFRDWYRVRDHFILINGYPFKSENFNVDGVGKPLVRIRDLLSDNLPTFFDGEEGQDILVKDGDIVIGMDGDFNSVTWTKGEALLNQRVCALRVKEHSGVDPRMLGYQIPISLNIINALTPWSTVKHLSSLDVLSLRFPKFDLPTQRAIADFLDRETARIDLLIEKKQRLVALLGEKRSATITAAVNGKIEVEGVENRDCLLAEGGGGVRFDKLKRLVDPVRPITYGIVQAGPEFEGGIPYIRPADMTDETGVKDFASIKRTNPDIAHQYRRSSVKTGDLVVSIGPSFGKVMEVPRELDGANLTQGTARVSPGSNLEKRFAFWCLRSQHCYSQWEASTGGATFRALNLGPLAETRIPLPDLPTQRAIADFLDLETARLQQIQVTTQQSIDRLKEYRSALITAAVTGQIDVAKWSKTGTDERQLNAIQTEMKH